MSGAPPSSRRAHSLLVVGAGLGGLHLLAPDPGLREQCLYLVALPIGYGHLLGAWLFAPARAERTRLERSLAGVSVLTLLCTYSWLLQAEAVRFFVLVPMLVVSGWHIAENDLALGRACREGMRLGPLPRKPARHAAALGATALLGLAALATPDGAYYMARHAGTAIPWQLTTLPDLLTAVLMYHAVSFVWLFLDRARALPPARAARLRRRLLWVHALPLAANAALYAALPAVHLYVAAPTLYLFFSVLHAVQTAAARGIETPPVGRLALAAR